MSGQKLLSLILSFCVLSSSISPDVIALSVYAQEVDPNFNSSQTQEIMTPPPASNNDEPVTEQLTPTESLSKPTSSPTPTPFENTPTPTPQITIEPSKTPTSVNSHGPSIAPTQTITPTSSLPTPTITSYEIWNKNSDGSYTSEALLLNKEYKVPFDSNLIVKFSKLPQSSGTITVKYIPATFSLDGQQIGEAYEITSTMQDGTFLYELSLPLPLDSDGDLEGTDIDASEAQVSYSEDGHTFNQATNPKRIDVSLRKLTLSNLDHFTIFTISADTNKDTGTGNFTVTTGPIITESAVDQVSTGTLILNAPAGFEFRTNANSVTATVTTVGACSTGSDRPIRLGSGGGSPSQTVTPTATTITIDVARTSRNSAGCASTITWSGIRTRPINGTPLASGDITLSGTANIGGAIFSTNTFTEVAGAANADTSKVSADPVSVPADNTTTSEITVRLRDSFNNPIQGKTISLAKTSGPGSPTITAINNVTNANGRARFTVSSNTLGVNEFTATDVTDGNLVITQTASVTFTDITAPVTTDDVDGNWHNNDVIVNLTCVDELGGSGCGATYYTTDGSIPSTSSPQGNTILLSAEGVYTIKYFSVDIQGNIEVVKTASNQVMIDKTFPTDPTNVSSDHTINIPSTNNTITMNWVSGTDNGGSNLDGYAYEFTNSSSWTCIQTKNLEETDTQVTSSPLADGDWYFHICTVDNAGNWTSTVHIGPFIIDSSAPQLLRFVTPTSNGIYGPGDVVTIVARFDETLDPSSSMIVTLDNGVAVALTDVVNTRIRGTYTVGSTGSGQDSSDLTVSTINNFIVKDQLGNNNTGTNTPPPTSPDNLGDNADIIVDTTTPCASITRPINDSYHNTPPNFRAIACDVNGIQNVRFQYRKLGDPSYTLISTDITTPYRADWTGITLTTNTVYELRVVVRDNAGNITRVDGVTFTFDNQAPVVLYNSPIAGGQTIWYNSDPGAIIDIDFLKGPAASAPLRRGRYNINGGSYVNIFNSVLPGDFTTNWSVNFGLLSEGLNEIGLRVRDLARNVRTDAFIVNTSGFIFRKDTVAPTNPIATPPAGDYQSDQLITLTSTDTTSGVASIYYTVDGSIPDNTKLLYSGPISADKDMTIKAIAYDFAGNASGILTATYGIPPIISNEAVVSVTNDTAIITWTTDDPSTSRVVYDTVSHPLLGSAPNYGYANSTVEFDTAPKVTSHQVAITGLSQGTTYFFSSSFSWFTRSSWI